MMRIALVAFVLLSTSACQTNEQAVVSHEHVDLCVSTGTNQPRLVFKRAGEARDSDCPTGFSFKAR